MKQPLGPWQKYAVTLINEDGKQRTYHVTTVTAEAAGRAARREAWTPSCWRWKVLKIKPETLT